MAEFIPTEESLVRTCLERGLRPSTRREYVKAFKNLGLLDRPVTLIDVVQAIEAVKNVNTRRRYVLVMKSMCPFDVPMRAGDAVPRQYYLPSQDEYDFYRVTFAYPERLDLMYYAGLRVSEACFDHEIVGNSMRVQYQISQVGTVEPAKTVGTVLIPTWLVAKLPAPKWEGTSNRLSKAVYNHSKRTGIPIVAHGLRAAYATRLVEAGISLTGLQQQMRHKNVSTTLTHYVQVQQSALQGLVDRL